MNKVGVFLIDDNATFLKSMARFLATDPGLELIGTAASGSEALSLMARQQPDLVLVDLAIPGLNGLEVTTRIKSQPHAPCVVIVTLHATAEHRAQALAAGADGFISKSELGDRLFPLIHALFDV